MAGGLMQLLELPRSLSGRCRTDATPTSLWSLLSRLSLVRPTSVAALPVLSAVTVILPTAPTFR